MDAQCDKLVMVVGHQFVTMSVHLCLQHDGRDTARHTGLSVVTGTCILCYALVITDYNISLI